MIRPMNTEAAATPKLMRVDVEALRAFAIITVIAFHAGLPVAAGFIGVDVFFAISGYLIIGFLANRMIAGKPLQLAEFWARRARRLIPASALVLTVTAIASQLLGNLVELETFRLDILSSAVSSANLRFGYIGNDYFGSDIISPVLHFWSLGVEEQFYVFIPALLWVIYAGLKQNSEQARRWVLIVLLVLATVYSFQHSLTLAIEDPTWAYFSPISRVWEFTLGGLFAIIPVPAWTKRAVPSTIVSVLMWQALFASAFFVSKTGGYPNWGTLAAIAPAVVLMWTGTQFEVDRNQKTHWFNRTMLWLGGISYGAYLWHWPILWSIPRLRDGSVDMVFTPLETAIAIALTLGIATLSKKYFEDPIRFSAKITIRKRRSFAAGLAAIALTAATVVSVPALPYNTRVDGSLNEIEDIPDFEADVNPAIEDAWLKEVIAKYAPAIGDTSADNRPSLLAVDDDLPAQMYDGCFVNSNDPEPSARCWYNEKAGQPVLATFGDSHMFQYYTPLYKTIKKLNYTFMPRTRSGCTPMDITMVNQENDQPNTICREFYKSVMKEFLEKKPDIVFLTGQTKYRAIDPITKKPTTSVERAKIVWVEGVRSTIEQLTAVGIKVVVIRDSTTWNVDMPRCLSGSKPDECYIKRDKVLPPPSYDFAIADIIEGADGIDLSDAICEPMYCRAIRNDMLVMRDHSHLSDTYATALTPIFTRIVRYYEKQWNLRGDVPSASPSNSSSASASASPTMSPSPLATE